MEKAINQAALTKLTNLRDQAVEKEIRATDALRVVFESYPNIGRAVFRHTAEAAGINGLTARNTFDRLSRK